MMSLLDVTEPNRLRPSESTIMPFRPVFIEIAQAGQKNRGGPSPSLPIVARFEKCRRWFDIGQKVQAALRLFQKSSANPRADRTERPMMLGPV
jgi:hypothetical protein